MRKLVLAACAIVAPLSAFGDVLFDQSPTDADGFFSDGISTGGTQTFSQAIADNFSLSTAATVTKISFWGSSEAFNDPDILNQLSWDVVIYDSSFNAVSSANAAKASLTPTATGNTNSAGGIEYLFTFDTNVALGAGDYFLHVGSVNSDPQGDAWVWSSSVADGTIGVNFFDASGWQVATGQSIDTAFRIEGQPAPEPASMAALGLGAVALIRRRRNRS